jgi:DNA-binding NtrC family response regulator
MLRREHTVCVVDDDTRRRESIEVLLRSAGRHVVGFASAASLLESLPQINASCVLVGLRLPDMTGLELQSALRRRRPDVPVLVAIDPDALLEAVRQVIDRTPVMKDKSDDERSVLGIIGRSSALQRVLQDVLIVAPTDATVLVLGETGTGKDLVARAVHVRSGRRGAFVKVNCAAVPANLLESELMGHEKGAFTGALSRRIGRFEAAVDGTIFLDEIGEMPLEVQPKLLRLLQEREFERLGSNQTLRSNARIVVATNCDLQAMVAKHHFREDLFYRLNVFPIEVPPLRDRREDIPELARHFASVFAETSVRRMAPISDELMTTLCAQPWVGNVRELQNAMERAVIRAVDGVLSSGDFAVPTRSSSSISGLRSESLVPDCKSARTDRLEEVERRHILSVLAATNWVIGGPRGAAVRLGLKRPTLCHRMKKLGITRDMWLASGNG